MPSRAVGRIEAVDLGAAEVHPVGLKLRRNQLGRGQRHRKRQTPARVTKDITLHLAENSRHVTSGDHMFGLLVQAGWHLSHAFFVSEKIVLNPLPVYALELKPVEKIWHFIRDNWFSHRIVRSYDDIFDHCCTAQNRLVEQP